MADLKTYGAKDPPYEGDFEREWSELYGRATDYLSNQGFTFGPFPDTDSWVVDEHYNLCLLQVETTNLDLIHPRIIDGLRSILNDYPAFALTMKLIRTADRPGMGIIIYQGKIEDELLRDHLPAPYRDFIYS
jgi:hypothetical protein